MSSQNFFGFACLAIGAVLVLVQVSALWWTRKEFAVQEVKQRAAKAADAASTAATSARAASASAEAAAVRASALAESHFGDEGMADLMELAQSAKNASDAAKQQATDAEAQADDAAKAAQTSSINDVLVSIAQKSPLAVLGFLFAVLGAMSMGLVEVSLGAGGG